MSKGRIYDFCCFVNPTPGSYCSYLPCLEVERNLTPAGLSLNPLNAISILSENYPLKTILLIL